LFYLPYSMHWCESAMCHVSCLYKCASFICCRMRRMFSISDDTTQLTGSGSSAVEQVAPGLDLRWPWRMDFFPPLLQHVGDLGWIFVCLGGPEIYLMRRHKDARLPDRSWWDESRKTAPGMIVGSVLVIGGYAAVHAVRCTSMQRP
jgi:hypothetical protein